MTHQTSWLGSTGECGVPKFQVGEHWLKEEPNVPLLVIWTKQSHHIVTRWHDRHGG